LKGMIKIDSFTQEIQEKEDYIRQKDMNGGVKKVPMLSILNETYLNRRRWSLVAKSKLHRHLIEHIMCSILLY